MKEAMHLGNVSVSHMQLMKTLGCMGRHVVGSRVSPLKAVRHVRVMSAASNRPATSDFPAGTCKVSHVLLCQITKVNLLGLEFVGS